MVSCYHQPGFFEWNGFGLTICVIFLSGCVTELRMGGVESSTLARAFQRTKERWISLSRSKVMII
jgi:hypothetical protein